MKWQLSNLAVFLIAAVGTFGSPLNVERQNPIPPHTLIHIDNYDGFTRTCGGVKIEELGVELAMEWGLNLYAASAYLTGKNDRVYPHEYLNHEGFSLGICTGALNNLTLQEFPIVKNDYYLGGDQGKYRVLFAPNLDASIYGRPIATFCGIIYHASPPPDNSFTGCGPDL